jgi:hypothetical protein
MLHQQLNSLPSALQGMFNFKPSVRPVPLEAHIQVTISGSSTLIGGSRGTPGPCCEGKRRPCGS